MLVADAVDASVRRRIDAAKTRSADRVVVHPGVHATRGEAERKRALASGFRRAETGPDT